MQCQMPARACSARPCPHVVHRPAAACAAASPCAAMRRHAPPWLPCWPHGQEIACPQSLALGPCLCASRCLAVPCGSSWTDAAARQQHRWMDDPAFGGHVRHTRPSAPSLHTMRLAGPRAHLCFSPSRPSSSSTPTTAFPEPSSLVIAALDTRPRLRPSLPWRLLVSRPLPLLLPLLPCCRDAK
jgi:hypothetical protein